MMYQYHAPVVFWTDSVNGLMEREDIIYHAEDLSIEICQVLV